VIANIPDNIIFELCVDSQKYILFNEDDPIFIETNDHTILLSIKECNEKKYDSLVKIIKIIFFPIYGFIVCLGSNFKGMEANINPFIVNGKIYVDINEDQNIIIDYFSAIIGENTISLPILRINSVQIEDVVEVSMSRIKEGYGNIAYIWFSLFFNFNFIIFLILRNMIALVVSLVISGMVIYWSIRFLKKREEKVYKMLADKGFFDTVLK